jgi:hypothetical protein
LAFASIDGLVAALYFPEKNFCHDVFFSQQVLGLLYWHQDLRFFGASQQIQIADSNPFNTARNAINRYIFLDR